MLILPRNLVGLVKAAATDNPRYAMATVHLTDKGGDQYQAEATNGRWLARVTGTSTGAADFPTPAALAAAPNSGTDTLVNADDWTRAFNAIPKPRKRGGKQILSAAAVIGEKVTTFGAVNAGTVAVTEAIKPDGRYPATDEVFPKTTPTVTIAVDPSLLAKALDLAAEFLTDNDGRRVDLELTDSATPIIIRGKSLENAQEFTALVMPLADEKTAKQRRNIVKELQQQKETCERLRESRDMYLEESKSQSEVIRSLRTQLEKIGAELAAAQEAARVAGLAALDLADRRPVSMLAAG